MPSPNLLPGAQVPMSAQATAFVARHGHLAMALGVACVVGLMILPVPPALLDLLIAFNIASSVLLLMLSIYISSALGLSTFPSLILITTVLRLALNIASTKQILLHADAGDVIETFGRLVMGGSVVVGLVVFTIIAVVQFIVISKGAERVAEVGARFTLDSMPGRQMSIEADLRANHIDKDEARRQRDALQQETHLHGSMDGAMKFVKGDAIAAIIIALVNIIAGISIGALVRDMSLGDAVARYTLLSVGDGMVSQIPSLLTSVAAGIFITRASDNGGPPRNLATQIGREIKAQPAALLACGLILAGMAAIPGFPKLIFAFLGLGLILSSWLLMRKRDQSKGFGSDTTVFSSFDQGDGSARALANAPAKDNSYIVVVPLMLRLSEAMRPRLAPAQLESCLVRERVQLQQDLGLPFPPFEVRFDAALDGMQYAIEVQEVEFKRASLADSIDQLGGTEQLLASEVAQAVRLRPDAFLGMQEIHALFKKAHGQMPDLSDELLRAMPMQRIADVLKRLALEGVSLRYLREVYESLMVWGSREKDPAMLCEYVRMDLGRFICKPLLCENRMLRTVTIDPALESILRGGIQQGANGSYIVLPPPVLAQLMEAAASCYAVLPQDRPPVLLTTLETRRFVRRIFAQRFPGWHVLSYQELPPDVQIRSIEVLKLNALATFTPDALEVN
jgi:type III secretion protein V